jgi:hypothetical protein
MRIFFITLILALLLPTPVMAADQKLRFKNTTKDIREMEVLEMLKASDNFDPALGYGLIAIDLNADGVDEWVVREDREPACAANSSCRFFITALKDKKPVILAKIYAGDVGILNQKIYGVTSLAVYNDPKDDFRFQRYHWKPQVGTFSPN